MTLLGDIEDAAEDDAAGDVKLATARRDVRTLKSLATRQQEEIETLEKKMAILTALDTAQLVPPTWVQSGGGGGNHVGIPSLILSDTHFDEVIETAEVDYLNCYNREIAEKRLKKVFENTIKIARNYISGLTYEGFVLFLGGDMVTGTIHEELAESNDAFMPDTVFHWTEQVACGLDMLVNEFGKLHVAGVVGNHGRNTRKPRMKGRARDNWDWLIYKLLTRHFRNDSRVTFQIPDSAECIIPIYETRFLLTHGDQFRGGGGPAGPLNPMMRGDARKRKLYMETHRPYDYLVMGHWHSYITARKIIANGSTKGFDEYAAISNFDFEPPQQAFWVTTPEQGPILHAPIFCQDRADEGW